MPGSPEITASDGSADIGLRGRKKAKRRQAILQVAGALFEQNGYDPTTMAEIAEAAHISPPTVFNYFGSKENILSALLFEGTERERIQHLAQPRRSGRPFAGILGDLMCEISVNTMRIAGKRVWRYAESVNIRRVDSDFHRQFTASDLELLRLIRAYLADYEIVLRNKADPDLDFLAHVIFDRWTDRYMDFIKTDDLPLSQHLSLLRQDAEALVDLLFDDGFSRLSPLKPLETSA